MYTFLFTSWLVEGRSRTREFLITKLRSQSSILRRKNLFRYLKFIISLQSDYIV